MVPLPAAAFELSSVLLPTQIELVPEMFAEGNAPTLTTNAGDVNKQPLLFRIVTV